MDFKYQDQDDWQQVSGQQQSPINIEIVNAIPSDETAITLIKPLIGESIDFTPTTLQINGDGRTRMNNRDFAFQQLHLHVPSEHLINNKSSSMELHFVHQGHNGQRAVIAVLAQIGQENYILKQLIRMLTSDKKSIQLEKAVLLSDLIPNSGKVFHYLGSLTTPPLNELVEWYVCEQRITLSSEQLNTYYQYYQKNSRHVQPLNDRVVLAEKLGNKITGCNND